MAGRSSRNIEQSYKLAVERFAEVGVDVAVALTHLATVPISLHCWQIDDVAGTEGGQLQGAGLAATGSFGGKPRNLDEMRGDFEKVLSLLPGRHRLSLHAMYAESAGKVDRNKLEPKHFAGWIDWAKANRIGLDFNGTFFNHPKAASGLTLSHADKGIRGFWVEHGIACRKIAAAMGKAQGTPCVHNTWVPDGYKDTPIDRLSPRQRLEDSLDRMYAPRLSDKHVLDGVEGKLFGIGSESYVVGSHEFYLGYAVSRQKLLTLDMGHYHPTESVADKISSVLAYVPEILLHVSRGIRWDSDHVVVLNDELLALAQELVRHDFLGRTHIGLDFFDASINRVAAYVVGARAMLKALMIALLEPTRTLEQAEDTGDLTGRLALLEEAKNLPYSSVWDYYCAANNVPVAEAWLAEVRKYEKDVLAARS